MPEAQRVEPETFPEVEITSWNQVRHLAALGYWLIKLSRLERNSGNNRQRYSFVFRMQPAELREVIASYYAGTLRIDAKKYDEAEREIFFHQKEVFATGEPWIDPDA